MPATNWRRRARAPGLRGFAEQPPQLHVLADPKRRGAGGHAQRLDVLRDVRARGMDAMNSPWNRGLRRAGVREVRGRTRFAGANGAEVAADFAPTASLHAIKESGAQRRLGVAEQHARAPGQQAAPVAIKPRSRGCCRSAASTTRSASKTSWGARTGACVSEGCSRTMSLKERVRSLPRQGQLAKEDADLVIWEDFQPGDVNCRYGAAVRNSQHQVGEHVHPLQRDRFGQFGRAGEVFLEEFALEGVGKGGIRRGDVLAPGRAGGSGGSGCRNPGTTHPHDQQGLTWVTRNRNRRALLLDEVIGVHQVAAASRLEIVDTRQDDAHVHAAPPGADQAGDDPFLSTR